VKTSLDALARRISSAVGYPDPTREVFDQWQAVTTLLAKACNVEGALVMRENPDSMEVMAASDLEETPYQRGETAPREGRLYCEAVIKNQASLVVEDAEKDPLWRGNPDVELGLASYFGMPVNWPDGAVFGTLCILSREPRKPSALDYELLENFKSVVELTLKLLIADRELTYAATHDNLTGLMNRYLFIALAENMMEVADRYEQPLWLVYWDLDRFKAVNDQFGHGVGDTLLRAVANAVSKALRASDVLARLGGEEFALLIVDEGREQAEMTTKRLLSSVRDVTVAGLPEDYRPTVSCGVTRYRGEETLDSWLARADGLMYEAKIAGRDRYCMEPD